MENFYKASTSIDIIEIQELLARKYDINYILYLEVEEGLEVINKALEKDVDECLWQRWLVDYRNMNSEETFVGFRDYKDKFTGKNIVKDSKTSYLKEAEKIKNKSKKRKEVNKNGNI